MFLQVLFILSPFHDRQQYNDKSTAFDTNMNKERFHNALALSLAMQEDINIIADAVHQAYIHATTKQF